MAQVRGNATREMVLDHASALIRERGFHSTSIGDVLERAGVQKGSFYYYFPSKEDLGHAVLDRWSRDLRSRLLDYLTDREGPPPLQRIAAALDGFVAEQEATNCRGGCPFGNLAMELADVHEGFRARLAEAFTDLSKAFADLIARAQTDGDVRRDADAKALGDFLVATIEGGILLAKVHKSCVPLQHALRAAETHVAAYRTRE
jgi:TetR/AcrR family transcriptional repressor of nem operon